MKFHETNVVALMAIHLDGKPDTKRPPVLCSICGKPQVQFQATPGLMARTGLPPAEVVCCNTKWKLGLPCPGALGAKKFLDALSKVVSG
jgi:hypothetical protein